MAVVLWTTPLAIKVAARFEFYDHPAGYKGHAAPTPYLGGAAVVAGFVVAALLVSGASSRTWPIVAGAVVLWAVGTVDDRRNLTPLLRVAVELALAVGLWGLGLGWDLGLGGAIDLAVTAIWIVAIVNAFNLFDNMDGASSSMAAVVAAMLAVLGVVDGEAWLAVGAGALCGACLGFLPFNLKATGARIFLGDGGSMPVGFAIASLTMLGLGTHRAEWQTLAMGLMLVGIPALDTCLVVVSRRRRGIPILTGGRDHLTHRTRVRVRTARAVAITLGASQALLSTLALVALRRGSGGEVVAVVVYLVGAVLAIVLLDARLAPAHPPSETPGPDAEARAESVGRLFPRARLKPGVASLVALVPIGLAAGLSPFFFAYYDATRWVPAGLLLLAVAAAAAIARPVRIGARGTIALSALAALALWSLVSALWADSIAQATIDANLLLAYAALLAVLLLLVRTQRFATVVLGAATAGALVVAADVLIRLLGSDPSAVLLAGRLNAPLGYINAEGTFFLIALWPCLAVATQRRSAVLAGAGLGAATVMACLLLLSQSRGVALATVASAIVVLLLVPGRLRRAWALVVLGVGVALAAPALLDVYSQTTGGTPAPDATLHAAARAALIAGGAAGLVWGLCTTGAERIGVARLRTAAVGVLAAGVLVGLVVAGLAAGRIGDTIHTQYTSFVELTPRAASNTPSTRLVSGAGNRYDYWRVAADVFADHPLAGTGAGNYDEPYFRARRTSEDIQQPHSIEMQTLSELGLVGAVLLLALLGAIGWGAWRLSRAAAKSQASRGLAVAGVGAFTAWLVHTSVDWIHLLPGVTAFALIAAAILLAPLRATDEARGAAEPRGRWRIAPALLLIAVMLIGSLSLSRQGLADRYRAKAQDALATEPARAITEADRSLRLEPESLPSYYVKAAALARFDQPAAAKATLLDAARREPGDWVTWGLLGDLTTRAGDRAAARAYYRRALRLNPLDPTLRAAVRSR